MGVRLRQSHLFVNAEFGGAGGDLLISVATHARFGETPCCSVVNCFTLQVDWSLCRPLPDLRWLK